MPTGSTVLGVPGVPGLTWYHTSVAVTDLDAAAAQFGAVLGVRFSEAIRSTQEVLTAAGPVRRTTESRIALGPLDQGHRLELGRAIEGPPLPPYHLGFFAEDLAAAFARMGELGWVPQYWGQDPQRPGELGSFSYHREPASGTWVELIDASVRPQMERWMTGTTASLEVPSVRSTPMA